MMTQQAQQQLEVKVICKSECRLHSNDEKESVSVVIDTDSVIKKE